MEQREGQRFRAGICPYPRMIDFDVDGVHFTFRAAGVCINERHLLVNTVSGMDVWFLPGGRVEVGETSEESLRREMQEELAIDVKVGRLFWVVENLFRFEDRLFHEIGLYYEVELPPDNPYTDKGAVYSRPHEHGLQALFRWLPLSDLGESNLVPPFLKEALMDLPSSPRHLIERR